MSLLSIEDFFQRRTLRKYFHFSLLALLLQITCHMLASAAIPARSQKTLVRLRKKKKLSGFALQTLPYFLGSRSLRTLKLKSGEKERTNNLKSGEKE